MSEGKRHFSCKDLPAACKSLEIACDTLQVFLLNKSLVYVYLERSLSGLAEIWMIPETGQPPFSVFIFKVCVLERTLIILGRDSPKSAVWVKNLKAIAFMTRNGVEKVYLVGHSCSMNR